MRVPRLGSPRVDPALVVTGLVAAAFFWVAYDNGSYGLESRNTLGIALWWALVATVVFGLLPRARMSRGSLIVAGLIVVYALWALASLLWTSDAEGTLDEFNRVTLYVGVFAIVTVGSSRQNLGRWADGLAIATAAVAVVALASRLFPGLFPEGDLPTFLPGAVTRLSFPLGYWNGLAIFLALGIPVLLSASLVARHVVVRGLALAPVPVIACVIYLASSRGGVATALLGSAAFLVLTERRWAAVGALACASTGSGATIAVLLERKELVNGPLGTGLVESQGRSAGLLIALACATTSALYVLGGRLLGPRIRPRAIVGYALVVLALVALVAAGVAADPVEQFETFRTPPPELEELERGDFVTAHLLSGSGGGRWQFWTVALDAWREEPLHGLGAGSYERWWAEHASFTYSVRDAHSLYLEALGELGIVGLALILALVATGLAVGAKRARAASGDAQVTTAAATATFAGYGFAVGIDWMWEMTAVSMVGVVALALVTGPATRAPEPLRLARREARAFSFEGRSFGLGVAVVVVAWMLVVAQAIPLLAQRAIARSEDAASRGDLAEAENEALAARDIQPWASSPYLQLSLVSERRGELRLARSWIEDALERDRKDWRLWLVFARIETGLGEVTRAERSLRRAIELNPRSPLVQGLEGATEG